MSNPDMVIALSKFMTSLPDVAEDKTDTRATFLTQGKIFAFTRKHGGIALKLPRERIAELVQQDGYSTLTMGKRTLKEWMEIVHDKPADYKKDLPLFKEAINFVVAEKKRVAAKKK